jgi:hypothetical protein
MGLAQAQAQERFENVTWGAMIDTVTNSDIRTLIFPVETRFQKLAIRPGGIPRQLAIRNAKKQILCILAIPLVRSARIRPCSTIAGIRLH